MKSSLPLPVRIAAGLAVTAVEQARKLPEQLTGLPVTVVSQALQLSMRVQQRVTELAIKGDDALASLRPVEETPEWATFDEDEDDPVPSPVEPEVNDPWLAEERAVSEHEDTGDEDEVAAGGPAALPEYDELSVPQLRARLRRLTLDDLEQLQAYEREHAARPAYLGMLTRRIATVRAQENADS
ncbi:lipid droplet-associated protein [Kutzneria sp. NPDC052558]|uniref:lipid droplet-associated protein n=1 Tax=Kutzneria sp. NPDC052558 TaxID=3364121 RepID=UPI0037CC96B6